ncbi:hypothetical protein [Mesorhizobium sp. CO1-1-8]|uniref:hypothetical protein n=1 Tax=Mesorhizobium sp. CO1-1-8 TaxID=2876631 RepID=UPI001CD0E040|nr:hypothetical protein [Mesorhizobium sp. CO1-1-8]MBZ9772485.1 hypothetical protein [Mesorhizobium sp. CO1-1-8]
MTVNEHKFSGSGSCRCWAKGRARPERGREALVGMTQYAIRLRDRRTVDLHISTCR